MPRHAQFALLPFLALLGVLLSACDAGSERVPATQITLRVYASEEVRERWAQLRVRSYRGNQGKFGKDANGERSFDKRGLGAVVDVVLAPSGAFDGTVLVIVDAVDRDGQVLVQTRATFEFLLEQQRVLELWLYPCELKQLGELCSDADCVGDTCLTCVDNACQATPHIDPEEFTSFDPKLEAKAKPPEWVDAGSSGNKCAADECDAGSDGGDTADAGNDAGTREDAGGAPVDAGQDATIDAGFDSGSDAGQNTGLDAGQDAGLDAGTDAGPDAAPADTGTDTGPTLSMLGRCAVWTGVTLVGPDVMSTPLPTGARQLAEHNTANRGVIKQYVCRVTTPDGTLTPAKLNEVPNKTGFIDYTCYAAWYQSSSTSWQEFGNADPGQSFEVLTPPANCDLQWVSVPAGSALPARALQTGGTSGAPLYSCRFQINTSDPDNVSRMGAHIGRVSGAIGDPCRVQYYAGFRQSAAYEVLVQAN